MHTETDQRLKWETLSRLTGHSVRYLIIRAWVRGLWPVATLTALYAYALTK